MGKQLREGNLVFAGLPEFRPELSHALLDVDLVFLQNVQNTPAAESFRRRPDQDERIGRPRVFAARIFEAAVKIDNRFAVLPNRNCRPKLAQFREILAKQRLELCAKLVRVQAHEQQWRDDLCVVHIFVGRDGARPCNQINS
jgi:hypothetical protein